MNEAHKDSWGNIIGQVRTPLGFYALSLLVIEAIFGAVVVFSKMDAAKQYCALWIMTGLFALVLISVTVLAIKWPSSLWNKIREIEEIIESPALTDLIDDRIQKRVDPKAVQMPTKGTDHE